MASYQELMDQQDLFVDESGLTSMEPEGTDPHHHHMGGWQPTPEFHASHAYDRWEGRMDHEIDFERGRRPAEGDGDGAPE
ncbi:MAG TPA: hypothetical protein VJ385_12080 [Fibrobacteria bacterium]|nr:hypothetical protein [Fibrobacteria bacterium]